MGLVPTMGYLHEGHVSLVRRCREENEITLVSIYVNPTQFGPGEDLERYPRDLGRDLAILEDEGADLVFAPGDAELYPSGFSTYVEEERLSRVMCGASRPGHFRGVCTIVAKLFNILTPHRAYFGRKDYQQLQIIRRMTRDLHIPVEVIGCPIVRESDGLARSSRNGYLTPEERQRAASINRALKLIQRRSAEGQDDTASLRETALASLREEASIEPEYLDIRDAETLETLETVDRPAVAAIAAPVGAARLIDNVQLEPPAERGGNRP